VVYSRGGCLEGLIVENHEGKSFLDFLSLQFMEKYGEAISIINLMEQSA
jgi:hypothetical protein